MTQQDTVRVSSSLCYSPGSVLTYCREIGYEYPQAPGPLRTLPECPHRNFVNSNTPIDHVSPLFSLTLAPPAANRPGTRNP